MKKAFKGIFILLLTTFLFAACSSNGNESDQTIFGEWKIIANESESCPEVIQLNDDQDQTFEISFSSETILEGTYEELEEKDHYKLLYEGDGMDLRVEIEGDHLIVSDADGQDPCEYARSEDE